ncbi:hypothetical protein PV387_39285, partial [Streptomyces sp. ME02-6987-2C]|uniref:hypothetical protein n=1 Tax=Streptomyces sp. ME02-6987-2C TaxID=3028676 RepID=UPI0029BC22E1
AVEGERIRKGWACRSGDVLEVRAVGRSDGIFGGGSGPFALRLRLVPSGDINQNLLISPDQKHTVHDPIPTSL